jgi:hypothetical protein
MALINREDVLRLLAEERCSWIGAAAFGSPGDAVTALDDLADEIRALPAQVATDAERGDRVCEEADGCPTETAVLKRFWREHQNHPGEHPNHPGFHNLIRKGGAF